MQQCPSVNVRRKAFRMKILFLVVLIIIVFLLCVLLVRRNKEQDHVDLKKIKKGSPKRDEETDQAGVHAPTARHLLEEANPEAGVLAPELELSDWSERLKTQIRDGMESIFSSKPGMADERKKPLQIDDIRSEVMKVVVEHLKNLKDFETTGLSHFQTTFDNEFIT